MRVTYDTNVFINYKLQTAILPRAFRLSAVVIEELIRGAHDFRQVELWQDLAAGYEAKRRLLVPNGEDWAFAGRVLYLLQKGKRDTIGPEEATRLLKDALIARIAKRDNTTIITDDTDFQKIQRYCTVKTLTPKQYCGL